MVPGSCSLALEQSIGYGHGGKFILLPRYSCWGTAEELELKNIEIPFLLLSLFFPLQPCYR